MQEKQCGLSGNGVVKSTKAEPESVSESSYLDFESKSDT